MDKFLIVSGVNESPMMTWGEIEGSPFRLDAGDTVVSKTPGPTFKVKIFFFKYF